MIDSQRVVVDTSDVDLDAGTRNKGKTIKIEFEGSKRSGFGQIGTTTKKTAEISLNDCLACSGCVTSAETVLITQQSLSEFYTHLNEKADARKLIVMTIAPQTRTSLARHYGLSDLDMAKKLTTLLKRLGVSHIFDSTVALDVALIEAREEFVARFRTQQLPVLASECPGWICYAEKTQGGAVLPLISSCKSPQQILGSVVKKHLTQKWKVTPNSTYHVTVMPCYDKKLEGSRNEFFDSEFETRDVDCVLTTGELRQMIDEKCDDFRSLADSQLDPMFTGVSADQSRLLGPTDVGGSGGYIENILAYAAQHLFGASLSPSPVLPASLSQSTEASALSTSSSAKSPVASIVYKPGRNSDLTEVLLMVEGDPNPRLMCARAYGFRNIQNLMRQVKRKKCKYHYVEIMACPSGCLNGGGQIKAGDDGGSSGIKAQKALVRVLDEKFHERHVRAPSESPTVRALYADWLGGCAPYTGKAREFLHTTYHAIEKQQNGMVIGW